MLVSPMPARAYTVAARHNERVEKRRTLCPPFGAAAVDVLADTVAARHHVALHSYRVRLRCSMRLHCKINHLAVPMLHCTTMDALTVMSAKALT